MNFLNKVLQFSFIAIFTITISAEYKLGRDYKLVSNPLPVKKDGIVEVTESFWYGCYGCYSFEPVVNDWASKQESHVKFRKMPVSWGPVHKLHAKLYYTIESLKLDPSTHSAVFVTMHKEGNMLQRESSVKNFLSKFDVAPEITEKHLSSFSINQRINRDAKHAKQLLLTSTPMIVVDGTYIIENRGSFADMLKVADYVIELQRPNS
jgi:thiol:disulfide interchange protein DsbA